MKNIHSNQSDLLTELQATDPSLTVEWDEVRGVAAFIRGTLSVPTDTTQENVIQSFLVKFGGLFGPLDLNKRLISLRSSTDDLGWTHQEFQQMYCPKEGPNDLFEVYGSKLVAHFTAEGVLNEVQSSCWREIDFKLQESMTIEELRETLTKRVVNAPGYHQLEQQMQKNQEKNFPIMKNPRLIVYPWHGGFRLAWTTYAYGLFDVKNESHRPTGAKKLDLGHIFIDAYNGEQILFSPMSQHLETPTNGTGLGVTPLGGPFVSRNLNIVKVDAPSTYRLRDTSHARDIITYNGDTGEGPDVIGDPISISYKIRISNGTLPLSEDNDKDWKKISIGTSELERRRSQQPEVDLHHFAREAYEWYNALAGGSRAGWDDGQYKDQQKINSIAHAPADGKDISAMFSYSVVNEKWIAYIQFGDGDGTTYSYMSGCKLIVGHEYQHGITHFSSKDFEGDPGIIYYGWYGAMQEGLSDVFGALFAEHWLSATEISPRGQVYRNFVYPHDSGPPPSHAAYSPNQYDHFRDRHFLYDLRTGERDIDGNAHRLGTILAHCAFLVAQGGVHQRSSRSPKLIPVCSLGKETVGDKKMYKEARIWYKALTRFCSSIGATGGVDENDENVFRRVRDACESAVLEIYGKGDSLEHRTIVLAYYAVGLHPPTKHYGADVTFLRWGYDWRFSSPYIGLSTISPIWSSLDLFINNGSGRSEWNAIINISRPRGDATQFENGVYCRVRNIGDQDAFNIQVKYYYAKLGTAITKWEEMTDKDDNPVMLNIDTLKAGQSNFSDSDKDQNNPPSSTGKKWRINPLAPGETDSVHHFCMKAVVTCSNDVNKFNNEVQSNIAYVPYRSLTGGSKTAFLVGNPTEETIPLELHVDSILPAGWKAYTMESTSQINLEPSEERTFHLVIETPPEADRQLEPPFDGSLKGEMWGSFSGNFSATLTETTWDGLYLQGRFACNLEYIGIITGGFDGSLDVYTGQIEGLVSGTLQETDGKVNANERVSIGVKANLRPVRRVNVSQYVNGEAIGGITIQVQVPPPIPMAVDSSKNDWLPPTDTFVA